MYNVLSKLHQHPRERLCDNIIVQQEIYKLPYIKLELKYLYEKRIVKLSATPLRNRSHMVFCSQGTSYGAGSARGTSVGCNPLAYL